MHSPLHRLTLSTLVASAMLLALPAASPAQEAALTATQPASVVPHLIKFSGALPGAPNNASVVDVKFALYAAQTGGDPLWSETQQVSLDPTGKYSVLLGSLTTLPDSVFAQGQARWIGVTLGSNQESARSILVATPYSLKASDSETLGGHPASDFTLKNALAPGGTDITQINVGNGVTGGGTGPTVTLGLSSSYLETLGNSIYPQIAGTNTLTGKNTYSAGKLLIGTSPVLSAANVVASSPVTVAASGNNVTIGLSDSALLTLGNSVYAQLGAANTFTKAMTFASGQTFPGTATVAGNNTFSGSNTFTKAITFASGQTFPGTGTITGITTSSPLSGSGTSGSVALSLNTSSLESTLNGVYSGLSANNTFTGTDAFNGLVTVTGNVANGTAGQLTVTDSASGTDAGLGVYAQMSNGWGAAVFGIGATGLLGETNAATAAATVQDPTAIWGLVESGTATNGYIPIAVRADNYQSGYGVYADTAEGTAVYGNSSSGTGVQGATSDNVSAAVSGYSSSDSGTGYALLGQTNSSTAYGAYVVAVDPSLRGAQFMPDFYGTGLWADTNQSFAAPGTFGALVATADDNYSGVFVNNSDDSSTLYLENDGTGGTSGVPVHMMVASSPGGTCGIGGNGDVTCSGRIKTAVPVAGSSEQVEVYSVQSSENWFEDFGSGQLFNGSAKVAIDPKFAAIVNTGVAYHVFLTPKGNCKGLFVTNEGTNGFEVRELGDGGSTVEFDYRIVAKRSGHESERLADATAEMHQMTQLRDKLAAKRGTGQPAAKRALPSPTDKFRVRQGPTSFPGPHMQASAPRPQSPADKK